jgi:hypothetical protein
VRKERQKKNKKRAKQRKNKAPEESLLAKKLIV